MSPDQFRAAQARIGCTGVELAEWLGLSPEHVSRMSRGKRAITKATAFCMKALEAGLWPD